MRTDRRSLEVENLKLTSKTIELEDRQDQLELLNRELHARREELERASGELCRGARLAAAQAFAELLAAQTAV